MTITNNKNNHNNQPLVTTSNKSRATIAKTIKQSNHKSSSIDNNSRNRNKWRWRPTTTKDRNNNTSKSSR